MNPKESEIKRSSARVSRGKAALLGLAGVVVTALSTDESRVNADIAPQPEFQTDNGHKISLAESINRRTILIETSLPITPSIEISESLQEEVIEETAEVATPRPSNP